MAILSIIFINIIFVVENNKLIGKSKFNSNIIYKIYNNKRHLSDSITDTNQNSNDSRKSLSYSDTSNESVSSSDTSSESESSNESSESTIISSSYTSSESVSSNDSSESTIIFPSDTWSESVSSNDSSESTIISPSDTWSESVSSNDSSESTNESPSDTSNPSDSSFDTSKSSTSDSSSQTNIDPNDKIPYKLLLGFNSLNLTSKILSFFIYIRNIIGDKEENLKIPLRISGNIRLLEEKKYTVQDALCNLENKKNDIDKIDKYKCSVDNIEGQIWKVEITGFPDFSSNMKVSGLADLMGKNLNIYATGNKFSEEGIVTIEDCKIEKKLMN